MCAASLVTRCGCTCISEMRSLKKLLFTAEANRESSTSPNLPAAFRVGTNSSENVYVAEIKNLLECACLFSLDIATGKKVLLCSAAKWVHDSYTNTPAYPYRFPCADLYGVFNLYSSRMALWMWRWGPSVSPGHDLLSCLLPKIWLNEDGHPAVRAEASRLVQLIPLGWSRLSSSSRLFQTSTTMI